MNYPATELPGINHKFLFQICDRIASYLGIKKIATGVAHKVPTDLRKILISTPAARAAWNDITPLARNEWLCWIENAKQLKTRNRRIKRVASELKEGMRRPCCWAGCIHR